MLNKDGSIPLYDQLATILITYIEKNLAVDEKMISEREICEKYNVSRTTVRYALEELEKMGFIYKRHGKGTFVSGLWKEKQNLSDFYSFTEQMKQLGKTPTTEILAFKTINASEYTAKKLSISEGERVHELKRLRKADGREMMVETTFIPYYLFQELSLEQLQTMSLYELFQQGYRQEIQYADEEIFASLTQDDEAELLKVPMNSACLRIFRTTYNQDNKIIEYTISAARGDQFTYKVRHNRK